MLQQDYRRETRKDMYGRSVDTICLVISEGVDSGRMCLLTTLLLACLGFFSGVVTWTGTAGARLSAVMAARYARDIPPSALPRLPRGVFFSLLFAAIPLIRGWCALVAGHICFAIVLALCCISSGAWLLAASALQNAAAGQEKSTSNDSFPLSQGMNHPFIRTSSHFLLGCACGKL